MVKKTNTKGFLFDDTPRGILEALLVVGGSVAILSTAPTLLMALAGAGYALKAHEKNRKNAIHRSFQYLKRRKYVEVTEKGKRMSVTLTPEGKRMIEQYLYRRSFSETKRPKSWDGKWRIMMFDISSDKRGKRDAFRGFIRRIGGVMLQKSVWAYPYDCTEEFALLKRVFEFSEEEIVLLVADSFPGDTALRKHFNL